MRVLWAGGGEGDGKVSICCAALTSAKYSPFKMSILALNRIAAIAAAEHSRSDPSP